MSHEKTVQPQTLHPDQGTGVSWEQGAAFFHENFAPSPSPTTYPWSTDFFLAGSGRDAFQALLTHGKAHRGWQRLWVPSYFCQDVIVALKSTGIQLAAYPDGPFDPPPEALPREVRAGDVLLVPNFFGFRNGSWVDRIPCGLEVIEDHSHDLHAPWAWASKANWCVASLRKTLPLPDGGVLWSPRGHQLPPPVPLTPEHERTASLKLTAMVLKAMYLKGHPIDKEVYLHLTSESEEKINTGPLSGISSYSSQMLQTFPLTRWREVRLANYQILAEYLEDIPPLQVLGKKVAFPLSPFALFLKCPTPEFRNKLRDKLIEARIYPPILWSLDEPAVGPIPRGHLELSRRVLSLHCDHRYHHGDMRRLAQTLKQILRNLS